MLRVPTLFRTRWVLATAIAALGAFALVTTSWGSEGIPATVREAGIVNIEAKYGEVLQIYAESQTTWGEWAALEPNNSMGLEVAGNEAEPAYAMFLVGTFRMSFPIIPPALSQDAVDGEPLTHCVTVSDFNCSGNQLGYYEYSSGRVMLDQSGLPLHVEFWTAPRPADPPLGSQFET